MKRYVFVFFGVVLIIASGVLLISRSKKGNRGAVEGVEVVQQVVDEREVSLNEVKPVELTQEQMAQYAETYKNPFVLHVRKALNGYLDGSNVGMSAPSVVIESEEKDGTKYGLDSFDKDYYRSKFVVYAVNDSLAGGKNVVIIFQDKPDKAFVAWVYKLAGSGEYDLRGFWESSRFTGEALEVILRVLKPLFENRELAL